MDTVSIQSLCLKSVSVLNSTLVTCLDANLNFKYKLQVNFRYSIKLLNTYWCGSTILMGIVLVDGAGRFVGD